MMKPYNKAKSAYIGISTQCYLKCPRFHHLLGWNLKMVIILTFVVLSTRDDNTQPRGPLYDETRHQDTPVTQYGPNHCNKHQLKVRHSEQILNSILNTITVISMPHIIWKSEDINEKCLEDHKPLHNPIHQSVRMMVVKVFYIPTYNDTLKHNILCAHFTMIHFVFNRLDSRIHFVITFQYLSTRCIPLCDFNHKYVVLRGALGRSIFYCNHHNITNLFRDKF